MVFVLSEAKCTFFLAHIWCCHFAVAASFLMILYAQKTLKEDLFNAPKIILKYLLARKL